MAVERPLAALASLALLGCSAAPLCENVVRARLAAPDGKRDALVFTRACGATTGESVQLSVVPTGQAPEGTGNVLIADGVHASAVSARWQGPRVLSVRLPARARTFHTATLAEGVRIVYR